MSSPQRSEHFKAVTRELDLAGLPWRDESGGKHWRVIVDVNGRDELVVVSLSPSDHRATKNAVAHVRRRIKQWQSQIGEPQEMQKSETQEMVHHSDTIEVLGRQVTKVEYRGQRVVTLRQIDEAHERPDGTAGRQFRQNRDRYSEGVDLMAVPFSEWSKWTDEIRRAIGANAGGRGGNKGDVLLFTERGYRKIVKGWNDDLSWRLFDEMVDVYFSAKSALALPQDDPLSLLGEVQASVNVLAGEVGSISQKVSGVLTSEEWGRRERDALVWHGKLIVEAIQAANKSVVSAILGGQKKVIANPDTWMAAGMLPVPHGDHLDFRTTYELLTTLIPADQIHPSLTAIVTNEVLLPAARDNHWPQGRTVSRSRSDRPLVTFPLAAAREHLQDMAIRSAIIARNDSLRGGRYAQKNIVDLFAVTN